MAMKALFLKIAIIHLLIGLMISRLLMVLRKILIFGKPLEIYKLSQFLIFEGL